MIIGNIHYLHFGFILFLISAAVAIFISLITPPIGEEHLYRLTFWTRHSTKIRIDLNEDAQYSNNEGKGKQTHKWQLFALRQLILFFLIYR